MDGEKNVMEEEIVAKPRRYFSEGIVGMLHCHCGAMYSVAVKDGACPNCKRQINFDMVLV